MTIVLLTTPCVFTGNVALVAPAGTTTLPGASAAALLAVKFTDAPPFGAARFNVTVPTTAPPPTTVLGLNASPPSRSGACGLSSVMNALLVVSLFVP